MATPKVNGTIQPIRTSRRNSFDPQKGMTVTQEFHSAGDNLNGMAQQCVTSRIQYDLSPNECRSKLITTASGAQAGFPDLAIDTWQVMANEVQKDIKEHPTVV